jgi:ribosomal protein S18 acetylase RimI-like enzyme
MLFSRSALHRDTCRLFWALLRTWFHEGFPRALVVHEYPAHLHINILSAFRGKGAGKELMTRFLQQVRSTNLRGVHASVREDNFRAIRFFKSLGFLDVGIRTLILPEETGFRIRKSLLLGIRLPA